MIGIIENIENGLDANNTFALITFFYTFSPCKFLEIICI